MVVPQMPDDARGDEELPEPGPASYCTSCHNLKLSDPHICVPEKGRPTTDTPRLFGMHQNVVFWGTAVYAAITWVVVALLVRTIL